MKKKLLAAIALLLLLMGCAKPDPVPSVPVETATAQTAAPTPSPTPMQTPEPADDAMVYVKDVDPTILAELHYATEDNFTGYSGEWWHYDDTVKYPVAE